jgi:anti-anti-sigma factor
MSELVPQDFVDALQARRHAPAVGPDKVMRVVLEGELGRDEHLDISRLLFRLSQANVHQVVLDLSGVTHFDYRGVRPLMRRAEVFRELGGDVRLCGLSPYLFAIFQSAGATDAFDYHPTQAEAVASFQRDASPAER